MSDGPSTERRFRREGVRIAHVGTERLRRLGERLSPIGFYFAAAAGAVMAALRTPAVTLLSLVGLVAAYGGMALGSMRDGADPETDQASIDVDAETMTVTSGARVTRYRIADMEAAWIDAAGRLVIRLHSGAEIVAELPDQDGRELIAVLGLGVRERAARLPFAGARGALRERLRGAYGARVDVGSMVLSTMAPLWFSLVGMGAGAAIWDWREKATPASLVGAAVAALVATLGLFALDRVRRRRWATVGNDGLAVHGVVRTRFLPWSDVAGVSEAVGGGATVRLRDGATVELPGAAGGGALFQRIVDAMAARTAQADAAGVRSLDRAGRTLDAWRDELHRLATRRDGYRETHLETDQLASVVADPESPPDRRVGAALVLGKMDEPARRRVRVAIDACAEEDMRTALERAAEGEIAEDEMVALAERRTRDGPTH